MKDCGPPIRYAIFTIGVMMVAACSGVPSQGRQELVSNECEYCPVMIEIAQDAYRMGDETGFGSSNERPVRTIHLKSSFSISDAPVTFEQWDMCVEKGGCPSIEDDAGWGRGDRPVIGVSWIDANKYTKWLSDKTGKRYRLPSEAEWEYVARGEQTRADEYGYYLDDAVTQKLGLDKYDMTAPVRQYQANRFGVYDMLSRPWEWVSDCWRESYRDASDESSAWDIPSCTERTLRGGAWTVNPDYRFRISDRAHRPADYKDNGITFRVVSTEKPGQ